MGPTTARFRRAIGRLSVESQITGQSAENVSASIFLFPGRSLDLFDVMVIQYSREMEGCETLVHCGAADIAGKATQSSCGTKDTRPLAEQVATASSG